MKREARIKKQEAWNWRKLKSMGSLGAVGFIMLFQYQNCAPAPGAYGASTTNGASANSGIVTTIDNVDLTTGVAFTQAKVQVPSSDQPTVINGACSVDQHGAILGWKVKDADGNEMETGYSVCDSGKFQVQMAPANELECDQSYDVSAQLNKGQSGHVELSRDCSGSSSQVADGSSN